MVWFPVVGGLVGLGIAGMYAAALEILPPDVAAVLAIGFGVAATGAFHEDGLADTADALGGATKDDALRIMKDPLHGTYGVLVLVLSGLLRIGALSTLDAWEAVGAMSAAHALSRAFAVGLLGVVAPAVEEGLGVSFSTAVNRRQVVGTITVGVVIGVVALGPWALPAAAGAALAAVAVGRLSVARFGGITGDVLGAAQQGAEILVLVAVVVSDGSGWGA